MSLPSEGKKVEERQSASEKKDATVESAENRQDGSVVGRLCRLMRPVRDRQGRIRFEETPRILREVQNLERKMYLVQFEDGVTTFLFPHEVTIL